MSVMRPCRGAKRKERRTSRLVVIGVEDLCLGAGAGSMTNQFLNIRSARGDDTHPTATAEEARAKRTEAAISFMANL